MLAEYSTEKRNGLMRHLLLLNGDMPLDFDYRRRKHKVNNNKQELFRHPTLSGILITLAIISAIIAGVTGFAYNLYLPTTICCGITFILILYVGFFEKWS